MEYRRTIMAELETVLGTIAGVTTVARSYMDIDVTQYDDTDLPLIAVREPEESTYEQLTSMKAIMNLETRLRVYFVSWAEDPSAVYETLMKRVRDKIGDSFTLSEKITAMWVDGTTLIFGTLPVYYFEISLTMRYSLNQKSN